MRIILTFAIVTLLISSHIATGQQRDSIQYYKKQIDSLAREDDIKAAFLKQRAAPYEFKRWGWDFLGKIGTGFITIDKEKNVGLLTGSHEATGKVQYYFKRHLSNGTIRTHPTSVYTTIGWGPTLVAKDTIPNYWYFNVCVQQNHFGSSASYGFILAVNSSGKEGSKFMYGMTVSLEGIQTPVYVSYLRTTEGFRYMVLAGIKISVKQLIGFRSKRQD
jgi:hypothetical protein